MLANGGWDLNRRLKGYKIRLALPAMTGENCPK